MSAEMLRDACEQARRDLDIENRAWILAIGRLSGLALDEDFDDPLVRTIATAAYASGDFPCSPLVFNPSRADIQTTPDYRAIVTRQDRSGRPFLESRFGFGQAGFVATSLTRSGLLEPGRHAPSHVLLSDSESVVTELLVLLCVTAQVIGYTGEAELLLSVLSEVPGQPLVLRAFDEETGDLRPAPLCPTSFTPAYGRFHIPADIDRVAMHAALFDLATDLAVQFEVKRPQFVIPLDQGSDQQLPIDGALLAPVELRPSPEALTG